MRRPMPLGSKSEEDLHPGSRVVLCIDASVIAANVSSTGVASWSAMSTVLLGVDPTGFCSVRRQLALSLH